MQLFDNLQRLFGAWGASTSDTQAKLERKIAECKKEYDLAFLCTEYPLWDEGTTERKLLHNAIKTLLKDSDLSPFCFGGYEFKIVNDDLHIERYL